MSSEVRAQGPGHRTQLGLRPEYLAGCRVAPDSDYGGPKARTSRPFWALDPGLWALLLFLLPLCAAAEGLVATTVEEAPSAQVEQAQSVMQRLHGALQACDGNRLYELLPSWERSLVPAIAFDAVHGGAGRIVGSLSLQQAAVSPYARAALWLRTERQPQAMDELGPAVVMNAWCEANRDYLDSLYGRFDGGHWYWLRTEPHGLLTGCLAPDVLAQDRLTLIYQEQQWRFALMESSETQLLSAFARQPSAELLEARSAFIARIKQIPPGAQADSIEARQALTATPDDLDLTAYSALIERLSAVPPCD